MDDSRDAGESLAAARSADRRRRWSAAHRQLEAVADRHDVNPDDLALLADSAWWLGRVDESIAAGQGAYHGFLEAARPRAAAMAAIGVAVNMLLRGDDAPGAGWIQRAGRLLGDQPECPEQGYLRYLVEVEGALDGPDLEGVGAAARAVADLGRRHRVPDLVAAGTVGEGRALVRLGRVPEGTALLDEAMVAVLAGELQPDWAGNVYCHMMAAYHELADANRAARWVAATGEWLATLPAAVVFTGICRVHRSQLLALTGDWARAEAEAAAVCVGLTGIHTAAAAEAHFQLAELRRLRGDRSAAAEEYGRAHALGRDPQPGLALLRLAEGNHAAAAAAIEAALVAHPHDALARARLRAAQVEVALARNDLPGARTAVDELEATAARYATSGLCGAATSAVGALRLAESRPADALPLLVEAARLWQGCRARYETARVRLLLARAYRALGDLESAARELDVADATFAELGAVPDRAAVATLRAPARRLPGGLTGREVDVLACLARGRTNRQIAEALTISEKTVERHLTNIFTKLDVTSRTAAAGFAHEHGLLRDLPDAAATADGDFAR